MEAGSNKEKKVPKKKNATKAKALLLGLGLDNQDGHVRLTRGPNFQLIGGSRETHEVMQETAVKFNEELKKRRKDLAEIDPAEFVDILHKVK